jgi:hypothetical protein
VRPPDFRRRLEGHLDMLDRSTEFNATFVREGGRKYHAQKPGPLSATGVKLSY